MGKKLCENTFKKKENRWNYFFDFYTIYKKLKLILLASYFHWCGSCVPSQHKFTIHNISINLMILSVFLSLSLSNEKCKNVTIFHFESSIEHKIQISPFIWLTHVGSTCGSMLFHSVSENIQTQDEAWEKGKELVCAWFSAQFNNRFYSKWLLPVLNVFIWFQWRWKRYTKIYHLMSENEPNVSMTFAFCLIFQFSFQN